MLGAVVQDYVRTAEPVSSRTIARKYTLGVSPATIRNEMSDLEELGYLEQPHTSAGRVPSDRGYRLYVDKLMQIQHVSEQEMRALGEGFRRRAEQVESLMHVTTRVLSDMTNCLSIVAGPSIKSAAFHSLFIHLISEDRALLVLLTDVGLVENAIVEVPRGSTDEDLKTISEALSERLRGVPLDRIGQAATSEMEAELREYRIILEQILELARGWPGDEAEKGIYLDGALNIMLQPEFRDIEKVRLVLSALENEDTLVKMFGLANPESVSISIGGENKVPEMRDCSVIWTAFMAGSRVGGVVGVLGPRRMDYARVVSLVEGVRERLSGVISRNVG